MFLYLSNAHELTTRIERQQRFYTTGKGVGENLHNHLID